MESLNKDQRYEYKYLIPTGIISAVIPYLHKYMNLDTHSVKGTYGVQSIYLDNINFDIYHQKLAGLLHRKKFRIRSYTKSPVRDTIVSLEIKEKYNDVMFKRRFNVRYGNLNEIFTRDLGKEELLEWQFNHYRYGLRPVIRVDYDRLAFVSKTSEESRVTLDSNIQFIKPTSISDFSSSTRLLETAKSTSVLEIKFRNVFPLFLKNFIKEYNLRNEAFSKYCECISQSYRI